MLTTTQDENAIMFSDDEGNDLGSIIIDQLWDRCSFESAEGESFPIDSGYVLDDDTISEIVRRDEYDVYIVGTTEVVVDGRDAPAGYVTRVYVVDGSGTWPSRCMACFCEYRWESAYGNRNIGLELYQGGDEEHPIEDLYDLVLWEDGYSIESH